ncbi:MAG: pyrimidine-nucleoside phosphorylase [Clostridia bacterium]|nr:pyrimidine-nucleoside phosphorylase [Clostridia bacterium]
MYDIIKKKRDGHSLSKDEIDFFITKYTSGDIPDYQASALLMAIYFNGMDKEETVFLTSAMASSGDVVDLSSIKNPTVDKHSTGGVGDKTTLIVAPIVAALGCKVAKMSGRGLGHTGGTIDKLEAIEGFKVEISNNDFLKQVNEIGICIIGQSGNLTPADKKLYALRDVTATVDNISLIASSIMSKKLAGGSQNIVLDVKCGNGAFMKTPEDAKNLARAMVDIGNAAGRKTTALITNMNIPLGYNIGNSLEVIEAIKVLKGETCDDLYEICVMICSYMYSSCSDKPIDECKIAVQEVIKNGKAFEKLKQMVAMQGGDIKLIDNPELFKKSEISFDIICENDEYISYMNSEKIGIASVFLGAGREKKGDQIDYSAGIVLKHKTGDFVNKGEVLATFYTSSHDKAQNAKKIFMDALEFSSTSPTKEPLIYEIVQ